MEDELLTKDKSIVVPGETLAVGLGFLPSFGTYREGDKIIANRVGLITLDGKVLKLIPMNGVYLPKVGDVIVAQIFDVLLNGWRLDTFTPYSAVLTVAEATGDFIPKKADLTRWFEVDDYVITKVSSVTSQNLVDVSMKGPGLRKLKNGRLLRVSPQKVPRIIGKKGSMVTMITESTQCRISVGQNGMIWIEGDPIRVIIAVNALLRIEAESHISGLTEKMKQYLQEVTKGLPPPTQVFEKEEYNMYSEEEQGHGHRDYAPRDYPPRDHGPPREHSEFRERRPYRENNDNRGFRRGPPMHENRTERSDQPMNNGTNNNDKSNSNNEFNNNTR